MLYIQCRTYPRYKGLLLEMSTFVRALIGPTAAAIRKRKISMEMLKFGQKTHPGLIFRKINNK